jgi:hypothetical protein
VGSQHFQYLGQDEEGRDRWLHPHRDGVFELFTAGDGAWAGSLGSGYDPESGRFVARFSAVETLNTLLAKGASNQRKRRAARLLSLFVALHTSEEGPYYVQPAQRALRKHLDDEAAAWVEAARATHEGLLARVPHPGTRVVAVPPALRSSEDHYRALVDDGYLDVAVVGGNSENEETGEYHSAELAGELLDALRGLGFEVAEREQATNQADCERTVTWFEQQVRVRVRLTAAARETEAVRRTVANFVEGLARADVVVHYGHSNKGAGYYLAENRSDFSRFRMVRSRKQDDLGTKCYGLGGKAHQILLLSSCISLPRYGAPIRDFYREAQATPPGCLGYTRRVPMDDFAPRAAKLLELLLRQAGPRELAREVNALREHDEETPPLVLRGVLQPRDSFVVPPGVTIGEVADRGPGAGFVVVGTGSDGAPYHSTGVFPQDAAGDVVQVVSHPKGVFGVSRDGRLLAVSRESHGAPVEVVSPSEGRRVVFAAWVKRNSKRRLYLLGSDGKLRHLARSGDGLITPSHDLPPEGVQLVAIGNTADERLAALDDQGQAWLSASRRWERLDEAVELQVTPSLLVGAELTFGD